MGTNIDCREGQTAPINANGAKSRSFFFIFQSLFKTAISSNSIRRTSLRSNYALTCTRIEHFFSEPR